VPTYQDIHLESITENADTAGAYDFNLNNGNKITKALPDPTRVPLSDGENKVYGTDGEGNQTTYDIETAENKENAIAVRNAEGKLESDTPTANIEVTNKGYVDGVKTELEKDIEDTKKEVKDYVDDNFVKFTDGTPATKTRDIDLTDERNIILGDNSKLLGKDSAGSAHVLAEMATYEISSQEYDQIEIGSESTHLNLNTNNDANF
jgi:hypothetical protein